MEPHGDCIWIVNPNDYWWLDEYGDATTPSFSFCKHCYLITLSEFGPVVFVNADNEADALDYAIDFCEDMGWEGLLLSCEDAQELVERAIAEGKAEEAYLEEYINGGNHGRFLSSLNVRIERVR